MAEFSQEKNMTTKTTKKTNSTLASFISGGVAGGTEAAVTYPFEYIKTRVQLQNAQTRNPFRVLAHTIRYEGIRCLYTGCSAVIFGAAGKYCIVFASFSHIKTLFADPQTGILTPMRSLLASGTAGAIASVLAVTPTERIKTVMIEDANTLRRFRSTLHAARGLLVEEGFRSLYAGLLSTTLKQASTTCVRLGTYDVLKGLQGRDAASRSVRMDFLNGFIAGTTTVYATQPIDVIKTRTQSVQSVRMLEASMAIMRESGLQGFWRGSSMRLGRNALSGGILFTTYEFVSNLF